MSLTLHDPALRFRLLR